MLVMLECLLWEKYGLLLNASGIETSDPPNEYQSADRGLKDYLLGTWKIYF